MTTVTAETRHFTASMVVLDTRTGRVLLVHHKVMGLWVFPGGHVDPNEAPHETAQREVREETGLDVEVSGVLRTEHGSGMVVFPQPITIAEHNAPAKPAKGEPPHRHIDFLYLGFTDSLGAMRPALAEVGAAQWFDAAALYNLHLQGQSRGEVYGIAAGYIA